MHHRYYYRMHVLGGTMRYSVISLMYNAILKLSNAQVREISVGNILTMVSADLHFCDLVLMFASFLWITPVYTILNGCILYWYVGMSGIFGLIALSLVIPLQVFFSRLFTKYHKKSADITSNRLEVMTELVNSIRAIKMHCLEPIYQARIQELRNSELKYIRKTGFLRSCNMVIFFCSQAIVSLVTFGTYVAMGNTLRSDVIFPSLALLTNAQYFICIALQFGVEFMAEVYGACERIDILLKEKDTESRDDSLEIARKEYNEKSEEDETGDRTLAIRVEGVSGFWAGDRDRDEISQSGGNLAPGNIQVDALTDRFERSYTAAYKLGSDTNKVHPTIRRTSKIQQARRHSIAAGLASLIDLKPIKPLYNSRPSLLRSPTNIESVPGVLTNISAVFPSNKLTVITGPVGSGKTLLINILLKELKIQQGTVTIKGSISYYDQNPCMINATVKDNILFGKAFNSELYNDVVQSCGLISDFSKFPRGDETEIGEKGVSLSGGQRSRIALARTLYSDGDIMILDDPLSALDASLSSHILQNCFKGTLQHKTIILVTHSQPVIQYADWLLVMNSGKVKYQGSPNEYLQQVNSLSEIQENSVKDTVLIESEPQTSDIIQQEEKSGKSISFRTYWNFINSGILHRWTLFVVVGLSVLAQGCYLAIPLWLGYWADSDDQGNIYYLETFILLVVMLVVVSFVRNHFFYQSLLTSNSRIHSAVVNNLLHAKCSFYDSNPSGRILNRVGHDINRMDTELPYVLVDLVQVSGIVIGLVLVTIIINPIMIVVCTILLILSRYTYKKAIPITRDLRRTESLKASELQSVFLSTIDSLVTIRSLKSQSFFFNKMQQKLNQAMTAYFWYVSSSRWMNFRLDLIAALFTAFTSFAAVVNKGLYGSGYVGASLVFSLQIVSYVVWMVRQLGETENTMTSTERVMDYMKLPIEDEFTRGSLEISEGKVTFDRVFMRYQDGLDPVLKNLSWEVSRSKLGIVGRSGSGKSTIVQVLLRLNEIYEGLISIDNVPINTLGVHTLRQHISVISQHPFIMQGSLRKNLDLYEVCSDDEIHTALNKVKCSNLLKSSRYKLDTNIDDLILSQGQKQLICLARVLLNKKKILILDEATASIDAHHEKLIRKIINEAFENCTVIEVSHKPSGVIDAQNVIVMENGQVKECGTPENLLKNSDSFLAKMTVNK